MNLYPTLEKILLQSPKYGPHWAALQLFGVCCAEKALLVTGANETQVMAMLGRKRKLIIDEDYLLKPKWHYQIPQFCTDPIDSPSYALYASQFCAGWRQTAALYPYRYGRRAYIVGKHDLIKLDRWMGAKLEYLMSYATNNKTIRGITT